MWLDSICELRVSMYVCSTYLDFCLSIPYNLSIHRSLFLYYFTHSKLFFRQHFWTSQWQPARDLTYKKACWRTELKNLNIIPRSSISTNESDTQYQIFGYVVSGISQKWVKDQVNEAFRSHQLKKSLVQLTITPFLYVISRTRKP